MKKSILLASALTFAVVLSPLAHADDAVKADKASVIKVDPSGKDTRAADANPSAKEDKDCNCKHGKEKAGKKCKHCEMKAHHHTMDSKAPSTEDEKVATPVAPVKN